MNLQALKAKINKTDEIPDGWKTSAQLAEEWGCSMDHAGSIVRLGMRAGVVDRKMFKIALASGIIRSVPHYAEKP